MHQQRGADASRAAPQDDAGFAGLEAAVLELTPVPGRAPKESDAVRPVGPEVARVELWELLRMTPEELRKQLSATDDVP